MIKLLRAAHERGVAPFDAAESYGPFVKQEVAGINIAGERLPEARRSK
jgi:hypothetical protein